MKLQVCLGTKLHRLCPVTFVEGNCLASIVSEAFPNPYLPSLCSDNTLWEMRRQRALQLFALAILIQTALGEGERYIEDTDRFPGWKGELPSAIDEATKALSQIPTGKTVGYGENGKVHSQLFGTSIRLFHHIVALSNCRALLCCKQIYGSIIRYTIE